jgi:hypothetical protein
MVDAARESFETMLAETSSKDRVEVVLQSGMWTRFVKARCCWNDAVARAMERWGTPAKKRAAAELADYSATWMDAMGLPRFLA